MNTEYCCLIPPGMGNSAITAFKCTDFVFCK